MTDSLTDLSEPILKKIRISDVGEFLESSERSEEKTCLHSTDKSTRVSNQVHKQSEIQQSSDLARCPMNSKDEPHILQSFVYEKIFPNVTQRYLTPYYYVDDKTPGDDICILVHSNRICMITLAPSHEIIKMGKRIQHVSFKVSDKLDRSSNKVSGKGKHGAQPLQPSSNICSIKCEDDKTYLIKCKMTGKLVEVNDSLTKKPELLFQPPHRGGYLAIALPNLNRFEEMKKDLLNQESYDALFKKEVTETSG